MDSGDVFSKHSGGIFFESTEKNWIHKVANVSVLFSIFKRPA